MHLDYSVVTAPILVIASLTPPMRDGWAPCRATINIGHQIVTMGKREGGSHEPSGNDIG